MSDDAHSIAPELGHNSLHGMFVLLQQQTQPSVFLDECMILYDRRCIGTFLLRPESFCHTDASNAADHMAFGGRTWRALQTFGNVRVESA